MYNLYLLQEKHKNEGNPCFSYFMNTQINGIPTKIHFIPTDKGGYKLLKIVFSDEDKAEFIFSSHPYISKDGKPSIWYKYGVRSYDDDGRVYECSVKPHQQSDRVLLETLVKSSSLGNAPPSNSEVKPWI